MGSIEWFDVVRIVTAVIAFGAFSLSLKRALIKGRWRQYTQNDRDYWWAHNSLLVLLGYGNVEQLLRDRPLSTTTLTALFVVIICFRAARRGFQKDSKLIPDRDEVE